MKKEDSIEFSMFKYDARRTVEQNLRGKIYCYNLVQVDFVTALLNRKACDYYVCKKEYYWFVKYDKNPFDLKKNEFLEYKIEKEKDFLQQEAIRFLQAVETIDGKVTLKEFTKKYKISLSTMSKLFGMNKDTLCEWSRNQKTSINFRNVMDQLGIDVSSHVLTGRNRELKIEKTILDYLENKEGMA